MTACVILKRTAIYGWNLRGETVLDYDLGVRRETCNDAENEISN